jgi:hypothetical protein
LGQECLLREGAGGAEIPDTEMRAIHAARLGLDAVICALPCHQAPK